MSKRKASVNNIIYELDNDDSEISSEDEGKSNKISRLETQGTSQNHVIAANHEGSIEVIDLGGSLDTDIYRAIDSPTYLENGGKMSPEVMLVEPNETSKKPEETCAGTDGTSVEINCEKTLNKDFVIESPPSDLGVVGCDNRIPIVTVRFQDQKFAKLYKQQVKSYLLHLIKLDDEVTWSGSETEIDLELDIWPEDLVQDIVSTEAAIKVVDNHVEAQPINSLVDMQPKCSNVDTQAESRNVDTIGQKDNHDDTQQQGLFFVDTDPGGERPLDVPRYTQTNNVMTNVVAKQPSPVPKRRGPSCFNCDGPHNLRECPLPRNYHRISQKRQAMNSFRVGRYHVEDDQKYGHLVAGRISGKLRYAMGLKRHELPRYVYLMRILGYPPGWLEDARISHSGIAMFDSTGNAVQDPEEEEGEVSEPGSKDKFDIKKILAFPGFNVPASSRYVEEAHLFGLPPISEEDSKLAMLRMLAPNAMKAYKKKKLLDFPSAANESSPPIAGLAEMELDSGDDMVEFPSVPPLPDEAPPPLPPPPSSPPPPLPEPADDDTDDVEVIEVMKVTDIPIPDDSWITIDEDDSENEITKAEDRSSPTLDDLEEKKRKLLEALENGDLSSTLIDTKIDEIEDAKTVNDSAKTIMPLDCEKSKKDSEEMLTDPEETEMSNANQINEVKTQNNSPSATTKRTDETKSKNVNPSTPLVNTEKSETPKSSETSAGSSEPRSSPKALRKFTPRKTGDVKTTEYGTPVMNTVSPFTKLPSDVNFAKDICDVINFENLPNSTGKYKKIRKLLKRVKSKVDKIQES